MKARTTLLVVSLLALATVVPAGVGAKENEIEQRDIKAWAKDNEELISAEHELYQGDSGNSYNGGSYDVALANANCQLVVGAEVAIAAIAASSALGLISDEDEVAITESPGMRDGFVGLFDEESSTATCSTPIGPVLIDITTSNGWGAASAHGTLSDAVLALNGGYRGGRGGGGLENEIEQKDLSAKAELDDVVHAESHVYQDVSNGAAASSNCQAVIAARAAVLAGAQAGAEATIEDSDSVVITSEPSAGTADVNLDLTSRLFNLTLDIQNDHIASSTCTQGIESITIMIRSESDVLTPRS